MDYRLDSPFECLGGFSVNPDSNDFIYGKVCYDPETGLTVELVENFQSTAFFSEAGKTIDAVYGKLIDGTHVSLFNCFVSRSSYQFGVGIGSPTSLTANRALFGRRFVPTLDDVMLRSFSQEISSITNWTFLRPIMVDNSSQDRQLGRLNVAFEFPETIEVDLPSNDRYLRISYSCTTTGPGTSFNISWKSIFNIVAKESLSLSELEATAFQFQNLISLLVGELVSIRAITISFANDSSPENVGDDFELVFFQRGRINRKDLHPAEMLLPYSLIKDEFLAIVEKWYRRCEQAILATNIFLASQYYQLPIDLKFLALTQAAESYHRSLGSGFYMDQDAYKTATQELTTHIPIVISGDHRRSLISRLKYGNEHSLRKRLDELFDRIPLPVAQMISSDVSKFVRTVVDTRNYHTHYDGDSCNGVLRSIQLVSASEKLRILVVANILMDLGIKQDDLPSILLRRADFKYWMDQRI